jgi:hypothetical protein
MKKCFVVASSIEISSDTPFTYSERRTALTTRERYIQTVYTIASIKNNFPDAKIYIVDSSTNYELYRDVFNSKYPVVQFGDVEYVSLREQFPAAYEIANTHAQKTYCECTTLKAFMEGYRNELLNYDFIFKASGRYVFEFHRKDFAPNKMYFKKVLFPWDPFLDTWHAEVNYNNGVLTHYNACVYGFGRNFLDNMIDVYGKCLELIERHDQYEIEPLLHHFTRPYHNAVVEANDWWTVTGFEGISANLVRF